MGRAGARGHGEPLVGPYGTVFLLAFLFIKLFEYNGGMLNQAQRYMATSDGRQAARSARLSAVLWLVWPLVLFFPMWMSPLLVESQKADGSDSYALMTEQLLPHGCWGWSSSGSSPTRWPCAPPTPTRSRRCSHGTWRPCCPPGRGRGERSGLVAARVTTVVFLGLSMAVATQVDSPTFKDIITVVIKWVAGLMGPIAIPMMLGLLRPFRRSGPTAALVSWGLGLVAFWLVNYPVHWAVEGGVPLEYQVSIPLAVSLVLYVVVGFVRPEDTEERVAVIERVNSDGDEGSAGLLFPRLRGGRGACEGLRFLRPLRPSPSRPRGFAPDPFAQFPAPLGPVRRIKSGERRSVLQPR